MAITGFRDFNEMQISVLNEIGNLGAGNAATALSSMVFAPTDISIPQIKILSVAEAGAIADMLCGKTAGYVIKLSGDLKGFLLFVIPFEFVERVAQGFIPGTQVKSRENMDEMVTSIVQEMVNIVAATYANNIAEMTGMFVDISVPISTQKPSTDVFAADFGNASDVCFINNSMMITDSNKSFNVLFFPELATILDLMKRLGLPCE